MSTNQPGPVEYGVRRLQSALESRRIDWVRVGDTYDCGERGKIAVGGQESTETRSLLAGVSITPPTAPESLCVKRIRSNDGADTLVLYGADERGLMYAMLEAARAIELAPGTGDLFALVDEGIEEPELKQRSVARFFTSEALDKSWYYSMEFWRSYFGMLAQSRYNRLTLTFGAGYISPVNIEDSYFFFPFPFLFDVPGYAVRAVGLPKAEQTCNLDTLKTIGALAKECGIDFYVGMWSLNGVVTDSPDVNYPIEGLTPESNPSYIKAAMRQLLRECPGIVGVSLRINFESGIREDDTEAWATFFEGVKEGNPNIKLDLRAKGIHMGLVKIVEDLGIDLTVSTKFTAEHMGLPYHQAQIRNTEATGVGTHRDIGEMGRRFMRYGYGDMLIHPRDYKFMFRLWSLGTQKVLLWGDPEHVAAMVRNCKLGGSEGLEVSEPVTYLGMRASVKPNPPYRSLFASSHMVHYQWLFQRYWQYFLLFGHLSFNSRADPLKWEREFRARFGERAAGHLEKALQYASKTLPLVTMAYMPSASNPSYWPEVYTPISIVDASDTYYVDTPEPKRAGTVEPLDTGMFNTINQYVRDAIEGHQSGKYGPREVSRRLLDYASTALQCLSAAEDTIAGHEGPEFLSVRLDVKVQAHLARFFAHKFLATMHYEFYGETDHYASLGRAVKTYTQALTEWRTIVALTRGVYRADLAFGREPWMRGTWADREPILADDLRALEEVQAGFLRGNAAGPPSLVLAPAGVQTPETVTIETTVKGWEEVDEVRLHFRAGESGDFSTAPMEQERAMPPVYSANLSVAPSSRQLQYYVVASFKGGTSVYSPEKGEVSPMVLQLRGETAPPAVCHTPPSDFEPGEAITLKARVQSDEALRAVKLHYRHVNQAEYIEVMEMEKKGDHYEATIPGSYTDSPYEMMYYFEAADALGNAVLYPGLEQDWSDLPYLVLNRAT